MKQFLKVFLFVQFICFSAFAQVDTINSANHSLNLKNLKESSNKYLVYYTDSNYNIKGADIWERSQSFTNFHNKPAVEFRWKWFRRDSLFAQVVNICDRNSLVPLFHKAVYLGKGTIAFDFKDGKMIPSDTVANNAFLKKEPLPLGIPVISWEQDLETYALLPIKRVGQQFDIAFFDPNEKAPSYHRYVVVGHEPLTISNDTQVTCWLLKIDYSPTANAVFWLSEKSGQVLKMKEKFGQNYRFKVLLF